MSDLASIDGVEKAHQPVPFLVPVLRAHDRLRLVGEQILLPSGRSLPDHYRTSTDYLLAVVIDGLKRSGALLSILTPFSRPLANRGRNGKARHEIYRNSSVIRCGERPRDHRG